MLVALISVSIGGVLLNRALRREITERITDQLRAQARVAVETLAGESDLPAAAESQAVDLGRSLGARVTIIARDGTVLGDSERTGSDLRAMDNHAGRPEVVEALAGRLGVSSRHSATLERDMLYVATPIDPARPERGVLRLAVPLVAVDRGLGRVRPLLLGASLLSILVAGAMGWLMARGPARRLQEIQAAAAAIAQGRMGARAFPGGDDEVAELARSLNRMADRLEEKLAQIERERRELRTILDGMVEGVLLIDGSGRIVLGNAAFEVMFGATGPLAGRQPLEVARIPALKEAIDRALAAPGPVAHELTLPGVPERVIRASLAAVREAGRVVAAVGVFHDITEVKRLERVRREFVANVSHELRTPLTAIKGYAETLLAGGLEDAHRAAEFVEVIARHADRLRDLIEDLLDLASIEQGEAHVRLEPVPVREVAGQAEATLRPAAERKRQDLRVDVPDDLPPVVADRGRLSQVLINLLDNAVKFTPEGGQVAIAAAAREDRIVIAVSDTGVGIPPAELGRIFERFYRVDRSRDRKEGGTGLGLAIARHLTVAMGGTLDAESAPGAGTTFRVTLPAAARSRVVPIRGVRASG